MRDHKFRALEDGNITSWARSTTSAKRPEVVGVDRQRQPVHNMAALVAGVERMAEMSRRAPKDGGSGVFVDAPIKRVEGDLEARLAIADQINAILNPKLINREVKMEALTVAELELGEWQHEPSTERHEVREVHAPRHCVPVGVMNRGFIG